MSHHSNSTARLEVCTIPIDQIKPDAKNPRVHTKRQVRQIANSIKTFKFNVPVLIDRDSKVISGSGRLEACKLLGWSEVPTIRLEHLTPDQAKAFTIADNALTDNSTWDDVLLAQNLKDLSVADLDFQLDVIGLDMGEIDFRIHGLEELQVENKEDPADDFKVAKGLAMSALGDLWLLDQHRILCADSTIADSYTQLMDGQLASMVFEDPPYNVKINGHVSGKGAIRHAEFAMASGEMSKETFTTFLRTVFTHAKNNSVSGSIHFQCMDFRHIQEIMEAGLSVYDTLKNLCVWSKQIGGMGSLYRSQHELIFVFKHGKDPHINNVELGRHGRYRTNVWKYKSINSTRHSNEEGDLLAMHPTVKPVRLVADAILDCSKRGNIVLDAFLGSGSTLIAAQRVGRVCFGMEIDPLYIDTAIRRWQADTGLDAVLLATGETFSEREASVKARARAEAVKDNTSIKGVRHD